MSNRIGAIEHPEMTVTAVARKQAAAAPPRKVEGVSGRKPIMGTDVDFVCETGRVTEVADASYERRWQEYDGTDHHWEVRGSAAGRVDRTDVYVHHYVERSETVGRNRIEVTTGREEKRRIFYLGTDRPFVVGDEVALVLAGWDGVLLVNETRDVRILTGRHVFLSPAAADPIERIGRSLTKRGHAFLLLLLSGGVGFGLGCVIGLPALGIVTAVLFLATWLVSVPQWRGRCEAFQAHVRGEAANAFKQLQLVRGGMSEAKAQEAAFGHHGGLTPPSGGKPFWMAVCERLGATAIPPRGSAEANALKIADLEAGLRRSRSGEKRQRTEHDVRVSKSFQIASDELMAAGGPAEASQKDRQAILERHRERVSAFEHLRPPPRRHMRSKGSDPEKWELQWGPPRWPEGHYHIDW
ncbi:hypothetical protein ACFPYM_13585 [Methylobacterium hispanicum]